VTMICPACGQAQVVDDHRGQSECILPTQALFPRRDHGPSSRIGVRVVMRCELLFVGNPWKPRTSIDRQRLAGDE
jgi:hypothetical protein